MNCAIHAEVENTAFCTQCGKPLCAQCVHQIRTSVYCEDCLANAVGGKGAAPSGAPTRQTAGGGSPEAAFFLGLIPGVGAIYNAEYFKAAFHLLIFATLVTFVDNSGGSGETVFGFLAFGFFCYMPFEAYFTAKKRKLAREGIDLQTPFDRFAERFGIDQDKEFWGGVTLVAIGSVVLLDNFGVLRLDQIARLWPVLLIAGGVWMIRQVSEGKKE